ncbi:response regulator [Variovorax ureilyticus]|uniref:Response regulator n=1 Tax=Variovorax ureilyticus TaxID=1836198 RepID=A0ABU8VIY0_9BURK
MWAHQLRSTRPEASAAASQADDAAAALKLLDAHPDVALLLTDVVMPEVNGHKLAEEALRRGPGLRVLFTTGNTRDAAAHHGVLDPGVQLIGKPFTVEELATRVRECRMRPPRRAAASS